MLGSNAASIMVRTDYAIYGALMGRKRKSLCTHDSMNDAGMIP